MIILENIFHVLRVIRGLNSYKYLIMINYHKLNKIAGNFRFSILKYILYRILPSRPGFDMSLPHLRRAAIFNHEGHEDFEALLF